uniref:Uncharacterized protein n=1 Tax=Setaria viridis TaxID=4556 RepID=A0A4U6TQL0_SETVI|nr:hypothetical protein SEVIR_7G056609v2 [Setaria viridis]
MGMHCRSRISRCRCFSRVFGWLSGAGTCLLDPGFRFLSSACARFGAASCGGSRCKETESFVALPAMGHAHAHVCHLFLSFLAALL